MLTTIPTIRKDNYQTTLPDFDFFNKLITEVVQLPSLFNNGRVLAAIKYKYLVFKGVNSGTKTHPIQKNFWKPSPNRTLERTFLHAEVAAYIAARKRLSSNELSASTLYVVRKKQDPVTGKILLGIAKPCPICTSLIREINFRHVFYTDDTGGWARLNLEEEHENLFHV